MQRGDRGLQLVRPDRAELQRPLDERDPAGDLRRAPLRAVLLVERHQPAGAVDPRRTPRVVQQQERPQPDDLGVVRQQLLEQRRQPDRLDTESVRTTVSVPLAAYPSLKIR